MDPDGYLPEQGFMGGFRAGYAAKTRGILGGL
jgi:hypothetical protein